MEWSKLFIGGAVGLIASLSLIKIILKASDRYGLAARAPEAHHTHQVPVPRLGGVGLAGAMVSVLAVFFFWQGSGFLLLNERWLVIPCSLAMFGLGLWDDLFSLGARRKFCGQLLIASVTFFCGIGIFHFRIPVTGQIIDLGSWAWPVTVFWLVAMTNLINLIDGVDGLAGGICLMLMTLLMYVSLQAGLLPVVAAGMVGALVGFLRFNFPPARIYLGDGGAYFLGFFIGCSTIVTSQKGAIAAALVAPLFVLALPIIDTSLAILRRGVRGLPLFRPDRKHIHHRLLAAGHSRKNVVLGLYAFTAVFLALGFATFCFHGEYFPLFFGVGVLIIILAAGKFNFSREWFSVGRVLGNSREERANVQYAMSMAHWLVLEGPRASSLANLAEDAAFIARKLGFVSVRIRLEDEEKMWQLTAPVAAPAVYFKHELPGQQQCFIELGAVRLEPGKTTAIGGSSDACLDILADLLAEGWAKAVADWKRRNQLPLRFDSRLKTSPAKAAGLPA